ncbi:MAG: hypothetical protein M3Q48_08135, partial [Actinomycetota bacterium]|nr:hypothetical protein [Actinomycetota bacterium]
GEGAMDYSKGVGTFSMTLPPIGGVELGRIDAVLIGTVMYQRFPPELAKELGGKPWIKIDLAEIGKLVGVDIGALAQSQSSDPTQAMALLRGASSDVTVVGTENLRGEDTTHYKATLDPRKAAAAAPEQQRKALEQVAEMYQGITIPADVWIDGANRLRKMNYVVDLSKLKLPPEAATSLPDGTMNLTMELFEFGVPVTADPPPADQVLDLIELIERAGAQG